MPLSYSQLSCYRRCPKQFEYAYVLETKRSISSGESFGTSVHNALRKFGLLELEHAETKTEVPLKLFTDDHAHNMKRELTFQTLLSLWRECFIAEGYGSKTEMETKLKEGEIVLQHFFAWWKQELRTVLAIERGFSLQVPGTETKLTGRFDRVETHAEGLRIIDFKTSGPRTMEAMREDLQLSVYALAAAQLWQKPIAHLSILSLTKDGAVETMTTRSERELENAMREVKELAKNMASKDFHPDPSPRKCNMCPYRDICPASQA